MILLSVLSSGLYVIQLKKVHLSFNQVEKLTQHQGVKLEFRKTKYKNAKCLHNSQMIEVSNFGRDQSIQSKIWQVPTTKFFKILTKLYDINM